MYVFSGLSFQNWVSFTMFNRATTNGGLECITDYIPSTVFMVNGIRRELG